MLRRIGLRSAVDSGRFTPTMVDWYVALLRDTDTMRNDLRGGPRFPLRAMDDRALLPQRLLEQIRTPMLFLWGEEDPFGGPEVARQLVGSLPNAELELWPGAGHAPWIDDPERAATTTRAFFDEKGEA